MDNEHKFEMWRTHQLRGTTCPKALNNWVWFTANEACAALEKRIDGKLKFMSQTDRLDFRADLILRFLEFIVGSPEKSIGWCFKTFKMRFPHLVTELEANKLGLGVKRRDGIQSSELQRLGRELAKNRKKERVDFVLNGLAQAPLTFDEEAMDITESGVTVDWDTYNVNRYKDKKWQVWY